MSRATPWGKFSLPGAEPAYARGRSPEFRRGIREIFGPLVEWVEDWPSGAHPWLMAEVPAEGSLSSFFRGLEKRLEPAGCLWAVFPKKPFLRDLSFPFAWSDVQKAGLDAGLVDNKIAAFSRRLTSIRFVIPLARRGERSEKMRARPGPGRSSRALCAVVLAVGAFACRTRSQQLVRLPLPGTEWLRKAAETRPGCWLSPGDAVVWDLPAGPRRRLEGAYDGSLAGGKTGRLDLALAPPGEAGGKWRSTLRLSPEPARWNRWSVDLPSTDAVSRLRITYRDGAPDAAVRSLFLGEPVLLSGRRAPPRTIVLFLVDTLRADHVSGYGYRLPTTPRIDRFFEGWLRARTCLPAANWTLPSHASLFTSASVARHRVGRYGHVLPEGLETVSESLGRAGFRTLAVTGGGYVDSSFGFARGFDRYAVVPGPAEKAVSTALAMLEDHRDEPAFLFLHTYQVHDFAPDEAAARRLFPDPAVMGPGWQEDVGKLRVESAMRDPRFPDWIRARYDAALASVDEAFGRLLAGLERQGRLGETAILFTSDHGEALCDRSFRGRCLEWGHGSPYLFEEELRVPLEARIPWRPEARGVLGGNATLLDVGPTLLAAAGVSAPASFEGRSLLSGSGAADRVVVTEAPPLDALALREGSSKLVRRTGGIQKSLFGERNVFYGLPVEECHDLVRDPVEARPLPCGPRLAERVDRYVASSFPDSLVVRVPARPFGGGRRLAVLRARGRSSAPAVWTFGLASAPQLSQRATTSEARFWVGLAPVWIAFSPADASRALEIESSGLAPLSAPEAGSLAPGSYRWSELGWRPGTALPAAAALFTTPPAPRFVTAAARLSSELAARLLSLGYLQGAPALAPGLEAAPDAGEAPASLSADQVKILRAD